MTTLTQSQNRPVSSLFISGLMGWVAALIGAVAVAGLAGLLGVELQIAAPPNMETAVPLTLAPIIFSTLIPAVGATLLFGLLNRFAGKNGVRIFQGIALFFLLLSLGGPLGLPVAGTVKIFLAAMHIVVGTALVWALTFGRS